jgi:hypothetical protein
MVEDIKIDSDYVSAGTVKPDSQRQKTPNKLFLKSPLDADDVKAYGSAKPRRTVTIAKIIRG